MLVAAVTLLLAAALFVGAAGADAGVTGGVVYAETATSIQDASSNNSGDPAAEITYWHQVTAAQDEAGGTEHDYKLIEKTAEVAANDDNNANTPKVYSDVIVHTPAGLGCVAGELMKTDGVFKDSPGLTVTFDKPSYDMAAHYWLPLSTHKITVTADQEGKGTATAGAKIPAMNGITFKGDSNAVIENLHIVNTLLFSGSEDTGSNNNYASGFIGYLYTVNAVSFENLTFKNADVSPDFTYGLDPTQYDPKGYNHIGAVIGYAGYTPVTFKNVTVADSKINGSSKVGAFIGYAPDGSVIKFETACKVNGNTTVTGFDGVGKLIGVADTRDPVIGADTEIGPNVEANIAIWPEASESYLDREVLGYIGTDGNVHELWMQKGDDTWVLNPKQVPAADAVVDVIKGDDYDKTEEVFTKAKIRAAKADLYTMMGNYGAKQISIYGKSVSAPVQSAPVDYVAEINGKKYPTLKAAIEAVQDGTATTIIKMIADHTIIGNAGVEIPAGKNIILDLNGHTVKNAVNEDKASQVITNKGTLTIEDSTDTKEDGTGTGLLTNAVLEGTHPGEWWSTPQYNYATNVLTNAGTLTIESGKFVETATSSICYVIDNNSSGSDAVATINGGLLSKETSTAIRMFCNSTTKENKLTVNGGKVTAGKAAVWIQLPGNSKQEKKAELKITGGELVATDSDGYGFYDYSFGDVFTNVKYEITGGKISGGSYALYSGEVDEKAPQISGGAAEFTISGGEFLGEVHSEGTISITGGIFDPKPDEKYIAEGYKWDPATKEVVKNVPTKEQKEVDPDKKKADIKPGSPVKGEPEETIISEISEGTDGTPVAKIAYAPSAAKIEDVMPTKVSRTVAAVYLVPIDSSNNPITTLKSEATLAIKVDVSELSPEQIKNLAVYHGNTDGTWNELTIIKKSDKVENKITITVKTKNFSPFAVVVKTPSSAPSKSSSSSQGSSVWPTNDTPVEPKVTPTPTPTPRAAETPSVKPIENPSDVPAKTPAPFLGILAGLGAAAVVFGLRRK